MALHSGSPLYATAMYTAARSPCASPATSTDSLGDDARATAARSPSTSSASVSAASKLPGLQFAISHRRGDLRLPLLSNGRAYEPSVNNSENVAMNQHHRHHQALYLSMPHCESPHYLPGVPVCPETSPLEKKKPTGALSAASAAGDLDAHGKKRKKGTRRGTLNAEAKNVLKAWMFSPEHFAHPYPSEEEKEELAIEAGIEVKQLSNWFTNARKRLWQPVLRQSGVEVKNFLSTGRGGPRGNKLDVPANLQHLIAQKEAEDDDDQDDQPLASHSPPSSPCTSDRAMDDGAVDARVASLKRSWHEMQASPAAAEDVAPKKKKTAVPARKRSGKKTDEDIAASAIVPGASRTSTATQLSQELRNALVHHLASPAAADHAASAVNKFKDIEILAAASLIGLHLQPVYQPVH